MESHQSGETRLIPTILGWIAAHPATVLIATVALVAALVAGVTRLTFSNDIRVFFSDENPQLQAYEAVEQTYSKSTNVLFVVAPKDGTSVFTRETLAALQELTDRAWQTPYSRRVDSLTNYQNSYGEGDDLVVEDLVPVPAAELTDGELDAIRETALSDPLLVGRIVSPDGDATGLNVPISLPGENPLAEQPEVAGFVRELAAEIEAAHPHLDVYLTGIVMINQELSEAAARDFATLVPLMFAFIAVSLGVLLRSVVAPLAALAVIVLSNAVAFGTGGWLGIGLSPPAVSAVNMIMTLAVADSVHVLAGFRERYTGGGRAGRVLAMRHSLVTNFRPVFLTSFTTVLGFLSLNTSDSPPFRDLGNIVALGVVFAWFFVHTLLPSLLVLLPVRPRPLGAKDDRPRGLDRALAGLSAFVIRRRLPVLVAGLATTLVVGAFIFRNELNDEFVKYFDEETEFRVATDFTIENLTGFEYIEYEIGAGGPGAIAEPAYLHKLDAFADWFRQQPHVRHVYSHTDMIKRLHRNLFAEDPAKYSIPESRDLATDCLTLYELSLPFGLDLTDKINLDKSASLFRVSLGNISSNEMLALDGRARGWLADHGLGTDVQGTGQSLMFAHIGLRNIKGLLGGTVAALVLISLCMVAITRSWKFGLISLLPNLAPAAIGFGIWGMAVGQVGLAISVVVGMTLGIVVDDSIHFLTKYLDFRRRDGLAPNDAIRSTLLHVGRPMFTSTVTLVGGFAVLAFSTFELNRGMGILSALVIAVALVFDLLVLPTLLLLIDRTKSPAPAPAATG